MENIKKYKNRHGDEYWFESVNDNTYVIRGNLKYWRYGGQEGQEQMDFSNLGFVDPSGGPFIQVHPSVKIEGNSLKRIYVIEEDIYFEVEK